MGMVPNRGRWEYELFDTTSTATFVKGSLVQLAGNRQLSEYSGGEASCLGIAMHSSVQSLPAGKVLVAIPTSGACTAIADVLAGDTSSNLSLGEAVSIQKSGNTVSYVTTVYTSAASNVCVIRGAPILSPTSMIEVGFLTDALVYGSSTSQAIA